MKNEIGIGKIATKFELIETRFTPSTPTKPLLLTQN